MHTHATTKATFMCAANPCVLPTVEQSNGNGCKGIAGTSIESGQAPVLRDFQNTSFFNGLAAAHQM